MARKDKGKDRKKQAKERARSRRENEGFGGGIPLLSAPDAPFFKAKEGKNLIDILPYETSSKGPLEKPPIEAGELWWRRIFYTHRDVGVNNDRVVCPRSVGKRCPICEERTELFDKGEADAAKALNVSMRIVMNIIDLKDEDKGIQLWEISYHAFGKKLKVEVGEAEQDLFWFYDEDGRTLRARFIEEDIGFKNKFLSCDRIDFEERDKYGEKILEKVYDLDKLLHVLPYETLQRMFLEMEDEEPKDDKEEPKDDKEDDKEEGGKPDKEKKDKGKSPPDLDDLDRDELIEFVEKEDLDIGLSTRKMARVDLDDLRDKIEDALKKKGGGGGKKKDKKAKEEDDGDKCPHGHRFGHDCDDKDECDECKKWDECDQERDKIEAEKD